MNGGVVGLNPSVHRAVPYARPANPSEAKASATPSPAKLSVRQTVNTFIENEFNNVEELAQLFESFDKETRDPDRKEKRFRHDRYLKGIEIAKSNHVYGDKADDFAREFRDTYFKTSVGVGWLKELRCKIVL